MNSLSPELVSHIVTFLPPSEICSLRHYATISRPFQFAIERHTFSRVILKSSDLSQFSHTFSPPHRRASLSSLEYRVLLPTYSHTRHHKFESPTEKAANNAAFTSALSDLFSLLASWGTSGHSITLQIGAYSPSDPKRFGLTRGPREYRYCDSSLSLLSELQPVGRITTFKVFSSRNISGTAVAGIAKNLPALTHVLWAIADDERKFPEVRLQQRNGLPPSPFPWSRSLVNRLCGGSRPTGFIDKLSAEDGELPAGEPVIPGTAVGARHTCGGPE